MGIDLMFYDYKQEKINTLTEYLKTSCRLLSIKQLQETELFSWYKNNVDDDIPEMVRLGINLSTIPIVR